MMKKKFRTLEVSNPVYETNNLRYITVKTDNLKGRGDICVFNPTDCQLTTSVPLVILLHGVYGSCWSWSMQGGVHVTASRLMKENKIAPMVIAMPSDGLWGDGSGYLAHSSLDFEKWIIEDVIQAVRQTHPAVTLDSPIFIGGLSMGGFGALRIGAKYSHVFRGISAHSSLTNLEQMNLFVEEDLAVYRQEKEHEEDVFEMMHLNRNDLPPFRFDCGTDDMLIEMNRKLHEKLCDSRIEHRYEELSGSHEWAYWEENVSKSLLYFNSILEDSWLK